MITCAPSGVEAAPPRTAYLMPLLLAGCAALTGCAALSGDRLDQRHDQLYDAVQRTTENTDRRYARKDREMLVVPTSPFRLGFETAVFDRASGYTFDSNLDLDMQLQLPNIERRMRIFVTTDDLSEGVRIVDGTESQLRIGARVPIRDDFNFDVGVRAAFWPTAFAAAKWSHSFGLKFARLIPFAKTYIESDRGFGVAMGVTTDHLRGAWLLRSTTFGDWRRNRDATIWSQAFIVAHVSEAIDDNRLASMPRLRDVARGYGLRVAVSSADTHSSDVALYTATLLYKGHLRDHWLYWYGGPEVRWERERNWHPDYGIRIGIDVLFRDRRHGVAD
jgi:hypothetical protein